MAKQNVFNTVEVKNPRSNYFDLSHDLKFSLDPCRLVPTLSIDALPGDVFNIKFENMLRFAALIAPIMHRVKVTTHVFFVPNRILWDGWEDWIMGNEDSVRPYTRCSPNVGNETNTIGSIADYMGIPIFDGNANGSQLELDAFPFAAVAKIYYDYYRDQNNTSEEFTEALESWSKLTDGDNSLNGGTIEGQNYTMSRWFFNKFGIFPRAWQHDYFTSALPFAQKGDEVMLPLGEFNDTPLEWTGNPVPFTLGDDIRTLDGNYINPTSSSNFSLKTGSRKFGTASQDLYLDNSKAMIAKTSELEAGAASINNLRRAFRLQEWLELNARAGTRYNEGLKGHFGVISSDARLQRAEYLGGAVQNMVISEVLSTAQTEVEEGITNPVGQMAGHGISVGSSRNIRYRAEEHGWVIGFISVMADTAYQQGIPKRFLRDDRFKYAWPTFAHIGEQEIENRELYYEPGDAGNDGTFGYIPRYSEYRFENNRVAGEFRDQLDFWHLGRIFENRPQLNEQFIYPVTSTSNVNPFQRIFAVTDGENSHSIYAHVFHKVKVQRKLPKFGTPLL